MNTNLEVRSTGQSFGLFSKSSIVKGDTILVLKGMITQKPSKYSIQLDPFTHLEVPEGSHSLHCEEYPWKFLNHHCQPNAAVDVVQKNLIALKDIASGAEICFDYNSTEYELAAPFYCECSNQKILIQGSKYADTAEKQFFL
jgi:SET domain-containing protein